VKLGRKRIAPQLEQRIRDLRSEGKGVLKIGQLLGVGTSAVHRVIAEQSREGPS